MLKVAYAYGLGRALAETNIDELLKEAEELGLDKEAFVGALAKGLGSMAGALTKGLKAGGTKLFGKALTPTLETGAKFAPKGATTTSLAKQFGQPTAMTSKLNGPGSAWQAFKQPVQDAWKGLTPGQRTGTKFVGGLAGYHALSTGQNAVRQSNPRDWQNQEDWQQ